MERSSKGTKAAARYDRKAKESAKPSGAQPSDESHSEATIIGSFSQQTWADRIAWGALLLAILLVPLATSNVSILNIGGISLFTTPFTFDQFDVVKVFVLRLLTLISLGAWAFSFFVQGRKFRYSHVLIGVAVFLVWVGVSTALADHIPTAIFGKYRRFEGLLTFVNYTLLFFLGLQYIDSHARVRVVAKTFFITLFIVSFYGVIQGLGLDPGSWGTLPFEANRAFSTYGNPDLLGGALVFAIPFSAALALTEERFSWHIFYWAGFLLNILCLIFSFVRGAWIATIVAAVIFVAIAIIQKARWNRYDSVLAGLTGVLAVIFGARSLSNPSEVMNIAKRFGSIFNTTSGSGLTRLQIWDAAIRAIKDRPLTGHGADTFRLLFPKYKPVEYVAAAGYKSVADNVHNYILQLASGIGILGVGIMYAIFIWIAVISGKQVFRRADSPGERSRRLLLGAFWTGCAAYLVHLFFGLSVVGSTFILWIALATLMVDSAKTYHFKTSPIRTVCAAIIMVVCAVGLFFNVQFIRADNAYLSSKLDSGQGNYALAADEAKKAVRLNPFNDIYRAEVGLVYLNEGYQLAQTSPSLAKESLDKAETAIKETIAYCPLEYDNYVFLTGLYNNMARLPGLSQSEKVAYLQKAIETGQKAIEVEPYGPLARLQLAQAYAAVGQEDKAREEASYALEMDPKFQDAEKFLDRLDGETTPTPS